MELDRYRDGSRLLADIGGTNARFALELAPGRIAHAATLACAAHTRFEEAAAAYLARVPCERVRHAVIAIANPVQGDRVRMTNHHWCFSIAAARTELGLDTLLVVNDFAALAMAVPGLAAGELRQVGGGQAQRGGAIGVIGAGTGLGMAGLMQVDGRWSVLESEGGHVAFSPSDEREQAILAFCWSRHAHVSAERLVSGPGLSLIHEALASARGRPPAAPLDPSLVVTRALDGADGLCAEALDCFCAMLGTAAANLAVTLCARGGIYIGGGIVPRLGEWFDRSPFRARFEHKGRFSGFTAAIPTLVISAPFPALAGAAALLEAHLAARARRPAIERDCHAHA